MNRSNSLFIGRFQPFHLGHLADVKKIISNGEHCIIAIGSTNITPTFENPLTYKERKEIIKKVLDDERVPRDAYTIASVPDIGNDELWPDHVRTCVQDHLGETFKKVYTGSDYTERLFTMDGKHEVVVVELLKDESGKIINATTIRNAFLNNEEDLVNGILHPKALQALNELAFADRLDRMRS